MTSHSHIMDDDVSARVNNYLDQTQQINSSQVKKNISLLNINQSLNLNNTTTGIFDPRNGTITSKMNPKIALIDAQIVQKAYQSAPKEKSLSGRKKSIKKSAQNSGSSSKAKRSRDGSRVQVSNTVYNPITAIDPQNNRIKQFINARLGDTKRRSEYVEADSKSME